MRRFLNSIPTSKFIYLDANVLIYLYENPGLSGMNAQEFQQYCRSHNFTLAVSVYTLVDLIKKNCGQKHSLSIVRWIETMHPVMLHDHSVIKKRELEKYVSKNFLKKSYEARSPFTIYPSEVDYELGSELEVGLTITKSYEDLCANQNSVNTAITHAKASHSTLKNVPNLDYKKNEANILKEYLRIIITNGRKSLSFTSQQLEEVLAWCVETKTELFKHCPSIFIEDCLDELYRGDKKRKPQSQDLCDRLQLHCVLPYCNYLVTSDKYMHNAFLGLNKKCEKNKIKIASIHRDLKFMVK